MGIKGHPPEAKATPLKKQARGLGLLFGDNGGSYWA